jgi:hypothetical protein
MKIFQKNKIKKKNKKFRKYSKYLFKKMKFFIFLNNKN